MRACHEHWKLSLGDITLAHHQSSNESRRERRAKKELQGDGGVGRKVGETDNLLNNLDVVSIYLLPKSQETGQLGGTRRRRR